MTIVSIEDGMAECVWMDRMGRDRSRSYIMEALILDASDAHGALVNEGYNATAEDIAEHRAGIFDRYTAFVKDVAEDRLRRGRGNA